MLLIVYTVFQHAILSTGRDYTVYLYNLLGCGPSVPVSSTGAASGLEPAIEPDYTVSVVAGCGATQPRQLNGGSMKIQHTMAAIVFALFSSAAMAFHCPADTKKIDDALAKNPKLTATQMTEVKKLRADGEASHKAGKHQDSVDTLAKAMKILDIK